MENKIPIDLDRRRYLLLDLAAVARFEYNAGKGFFLVKTWKKLSARDSALLLWACLVHEDPGLTPGALLRIIAEKKIDVQQVIDKVNTAWALLINSIIGGGDNHGDHSR